jgi:hypothetical protein
MRNTADVTGGKAIAVFLQSMSGVTAINPLVAFYDIHGGKREVLFVLFYPGHHARCPGYHTREIIVITNKYISYLFSYPFTLSLCTIIIT